MHTAVLSPPPECLPLIVEQESKQAPQQDQAPIRHDGRNIPIRNNPIGDELAEPIPPHILVDRNADEQAARNRLVGVDGVRADNTGKGRDLDSSACIPNQDDGLPRPGILISHRDDDVAQVHDHHVGDHGREAHFRLADAAVASGGARGHPVGEGACGCEADHRADEDGEVGEACWLTESVMLDGTVNPCKRSPLTDTLAAPEIGWCGEGLGLCEIEREERTAAPADDEAGEFGDWESEHFPR